MEYGCPVCNGLTNIEKSCPQCGSPLKDNGMVENYYGPYSPYDDPEAYEPQVLWPMPETSPCMHLCSCPRCGFDTRIEVCQVVMG
ncbi:MAG: hypothetical protein RO469_13595 [Thermincola sp.]|nr:hypothetical protein [Thermincola sp.]MDT3704154.1 hypothetical protein [Thermincola sp.]